MELLVCLYFTLGSVNLTNCNNDQIGPTNIEVCAWPLSYLPFSPREMTEKTWDSDLLGQLVELEAWSSDRKAAWLNCWSMASSTGSHVWCSWCWDACHGDVLWVPPLPPFASNESRIGGPEWRKLNFTQLVHHISVSTGWMWPFFHFPLPFQLLWVLLDYLSYICWSNTRWVMCILALYSCSLGPAQL